VKMLTLQAFMFASLCICGSTNMFRVLSTVWWLKSLNGQKRALLYAPCAMLPALIRHPFSFFCSLSSVICPQFLYSAFRIPTSAFKSLCHPSSVPCHPSSVIRRLLFRWARILAIINPIPMGCISSSSDFSFLRVSTKALAGGESTCPLR